MGVGMIKSKLCCIIKAVVKCSECGALSCRECWSSSTNYIGHSGTYSTNMKCPVTNNAVMWKHVFTTSSDPQLLIKCNDQTKVRN